MKRAFAALGAFIIIGITGLGVLFGAAPASAASCIQGTAGCAPAMTYNGTDGGSMTYNGADGPSMIHN